MTQEKEVEAELLDSQQEIASLACPLVPVIDGVAVLPLIGKMNQGRLKRVLTVTTDEIMKQRLETIIVDLSGVTSVNDLLLTDLTTLKHVIRLQGAELIITGMSAELVLGAVKTNQLLYNQLKTASTVKDVIARMMKERS